MKLTFKQFLSEAKYAGQTPEALISRLTEIVYDVFEFVYADDYNNREEYTSALIDKVIKDIQKEVPGKWKKTFAEVVWSVYHDLDESDFADTESMVDALMNDIVKEIRWHVNHGVPV
jgi:hypothetical protein